MYLKRANIAGNIIKLNTFRNGLTIKNLTPINMINKLGHQINSVNNLKFCNVTSKSIFMKCNNMVSNHDSINSGLSGKMSFPYFKQMNKTSRRFFSEQIKKESSNKEEKQNNVKKAFSKKRKSKVNKTIKLKNYPEYGEIILNLFSKNPILLTQSVTEAENNSKYLEILNNEKKLYEEVTNLLGEGKLEKAALEISNLIDYLKNLEFTDNKNVSLLDNPKIRNKTILKKIQIYKITLADIHSILGSVYESEFELKNVISLMEANAEKLTDQDRFLLMKLKERLCTSYLTRDEFDFIEDKLNEECEKFIESNIDYTEKKAASPEIEKQQNIFLNFQKMLLENIHFLAIVFKKQNKFKESNKQLMKYLQVKERFPILTQYLINYEYSVHLNLALNFLGLNDLENSVSYFNLVLGYLNDESKETFLESKILIVDKLCAIYEQQAEIRKLMEQLEEKKRLTILLINVKTNSIKEFIENRSKMEGDSETTPSEDNNNTGNNQNQNNLLEKKRNENIDDKNILKKDPQIDSNKSQEASEANTEFKNDPFFKDYEDFALKKDYLSLAKTYEELIELILENEVQPEKFEEYLREAQKYYDMLEKEEVFAANLNFILFIKNFDDSQHQSALEYGLKILNAIEDFEARTAYILDPENFENMEEFEIEFMQINLRFYNLDEKEQRAYLLRPFTNFDFYNFEKRFKFYFYISKIYKALNDQEEKIKYQNLALKDYEEFIEENKQIEDDQNDENVPGNSSNDISVFHLIDLMSIYENRRISDKLSVVFDKIVTKFKAGEIDFLKKEDKETYTKTIYDAYFIKINYLIFEEKFQEAKDLLKALDTFALENQYVTFSEGQRDNLNKTLNLLDLKLKYIK